jgi:hypothetical protein
MIAKLTAACFELGRLACDRFPGGKVTTTARMKDGREVTRTLYVE